MRVCATYMQPQQSLFLYRCWVTREPAADETKHFLHREGQGAQLDIKHLAVRGWYKRISGSCSVKQDGGFIKPYLP